jgi:erythromycin esterase-like protein
MLDPERGIRSARQIPREEYQRYRFVVRELRAIAETTHDQTAAVQVPTEVAFYLRVLANLDTYLSFLESLRHGPRSGWTEIRDTAMASNVIWLTENRYVGRKLIGWAHSGHIMRSANSIDTMDPNR